MQWRSSSRRQGRGDASPVRDPPQPYAVWWKVRDHGPDAEKAHDLRGQTTPGRGPRSHESTRHRVQHMWRYGSSRTARSSSGRRA
ncbi:hypothetical protein ABZ686_08540 [Streptomyces sp. NPDC006992]|uniref:nucleotide-binding domain-containing protein n=1 Tax=unclassified Streptomyces TaxID=2593676 RepID=UPI0033F0EB07